MPSPNADNLSPALHAVADPTRRAILAQLASGEERTAKSLADAFAVTFSAVSQHLRVLRAAELVTVERRGRERWYRLNADPLREIAEWTRTYERFWQERMARLGSHLEQQKQHDKDGKESEGGEGR